jgi:hypothetical protein
MKSRVCPNWLFALAFGVIAPCVMGCAEEDAEGYEAAYPVGASVPPAAPPPAPPASAPAYAPAPQPSQEVVVGDDSSTAEAPAGDYADSDPSALTDFRSTLDPYGTWEEDPTYGTVWVPSSTEVGPDFVPYQSAGHWAYDDDYVWVSDYSWGWAPFHYGRWVYGGGYGWEWIPGRRYAGAWVSWRYGWDDWAYVGWAPLSPTWCWHRGIAVGVGFVPVAPYGFVATGDLFAPRLGARLVVGERVGVIAGHTRPWVAATPGVAGRVIARPAVGGPPPGVMRIPASAVVRVGSNQGIAQARAFGRPSVAASAGIARGSGSSPSPMFSTASRGGAPQYSQVARASAPAYGPPAPSHFGGKLGAGFSGNGVTSAWGPARSPSAMSAPSTIQSARPTFASPSAHIAAPSYHGGGSFPAAPSAPAFHGASGGTPTGGFHGGGGYSGGFHGSSGLSGGGYHGGGGGGGFHGGGGGGSHGGGGHR